MSANRREIILIVDNIRSLYNAGSIFRTADAFAVDKIIFTGTSPTPKRVNDKRLPHVIAKATKQISKVALGAEQTVPFEYCALAADAIAKLKLNGFKIYAIEQDPKSTSLDKVKPGLKVALVVGNEVDGISKSTLDLVDTIAELPMAGSKESLNVSVMTGIALYHFYR